MARIIIICIVAAVIAAVYMVTAWHGGGESIQTLNVLCGAGLMKPMDEIIGRFEDGHRAKVIVNYGGSGEMLGQLALERSCDVFIPAAGKYMEDAARNGWIVEGTVRDIAKHIPVIAVARENPKKIEALSDLAQTGIVVALGDPDACAIGRVSDAILEKNGLAGEVQLNVKVRAPTVNQLLLYVTLDQADAAIIWEDMAMWAESMEKLTIIRIPGGQNIIKTIPTAVASGSRNRRLAEAFNEFVDSDEAHRIWTRWGFHICAE